MHHLIWEHSSKIIPIVNMSHWEDWDFQWSVEYCRSRYNYHTDFEYDEKSATAIKKHAEYVLENIKSLHSNNSKELRLTLGDIEAMAHLGNYYAEMMLGNQQLAAGNWRKYAAVAGNQYKPQLLGRAGWGDWKEFFGVISKNGSVSSSATSGGTIWEAEKAKLKNFIAEDSIKGFTGTGYIVPNSENASMQWKIKVPDSGEYTLELRYILTNQKVELPVTINNKRAGNIKCWETGGSDIWAWDRKVINLKKGSNVIEMEMPVTNIKIDHLNIW